MDAYSSCWLLSFLSHTDFNDSLGLWACGSLRLGCASGSSVWLHSWAGTSLFLTLVLVLVYLLSGMRSYVRLNLSESTLSPVTWLTGQHTQTLTHTQTNSFNDMAFLVSRTAYLNSDQIKKPCVHTAKLSNAHTYCTHWCWGLTLCLRTVSWRVRFYDQ